jgi:hypothetical protein
MNVIEFYYDETFAGLKYQIIGPEDCGSLSLDSENLRAVSGEPSGSKPLVKNGFVFLGWFTDPDCKVAVDSSWVDGDYLLKPQKTADVWQNTIYYAKFAALETELTITTKSTVDTDQVFIFHIQGKADTETADIDLTVTVVGDNSVTITKLPVGNYTVSQLTDWSWRYKNAEAKRNVALAYTEGANEIVYDNSRANGKWLDGNNFKDNLY